ncbi:hypothetical protein AVEN_38329-1 [Araneus ventricosus]|uniref:Uncharacterized protein n=1 Tax=Araneus ventricosus TaxID=182803 RepID=A0A4Y2PAF9_ARAVE|nr:hypothetical protein AVEN_38329-1 [Araneus ventricosus]
MWGRIASTMKTEHTACRRSWADPSGGHQGITLSSLDDDVTRDDEYLMNCYLLRNIEKSQIPVMSITVKCRLSRELRHGIAEELKFVMGSVISMEL